MSNPDLKIVDADFEAAVASLIRIESGFTGMTEADGELADAVGHAGLSRAVTDFSASWRVKRQDLLKEISGHRESLQAVRDAFTRIDDSFGKRSDGGGDHSAGDRAPSTPVPGAPGPGLLPAGRPAPSSPGDIGAGALGGGPEAGLMAGASHQAIAHDDAQGEVTGNLVAGAPLSPTDENLLHRVREVLGDVVSVDLQPGDHDEVLLTVGGIAGVSLSALALLIARGATCQTATAGAVDSSSALRQALAGIGRGGGSSPPTRADRDSILERLLGRAHPEDPTSTDPGGQPADEGGPDEAFGNQDGHPDGDAGVPGRGEADDGPLGQDLPLEGAGGSPGGDGVPGGGGAAENLGPALPTSTTEDGGAALTPENPGTDGIPSGSEAADATGPAPVPAQADDATRTAPMMGGLGMAAGMSAAGATRSGIDEDKRDEEARRLRERLATVKEKNR